MSRQLDRDEDLAFDHHAFRAASFEPVCPDGEIAGLLDGMTELVGGTGMISGDSDGESRGIEVYGITEEGDLYRRNGYYQTDGRAISNEMQEFDAGNSQDACDPAANEAPPRCVDHAPLREGALQKTRAASSRRMPTRSSLVALVRAIDARRSSAPASAMTRRLAPWG